MGQLRSLNPARVCAARSKSDEQTPAQHKAGDFLFGLDSWRRIPCPLATFADAQSRLGEGLSSKCESCADWHIGEISFA
jgi:hypothetical protein